MATTLQHVRTCDFTGALAGVELARGDLDCGDGAC